MSRTQEAWPALGWAEWQETGATLQRWAQIVGKIRLRLTPWVNHSWSVVLYPTVRGLTTSPIPHGTRTFQIDFDFVAQRLVIATAEGDRREVELRPRSVADFHDEVFAHLHALELPVTIDHVPNEVEDGTRLDRDRHHSAYDPDAAQRFWRILLSTRRVMHRFRASFIGKCSPIHFFWGGMDLAVTRFSGRTAPQHPGGIPHLNDAITREAYSHEVSSCGFWPGGNGIEHAAFYAYAYPGPEGFSAAKVRPAEAAWSTTLGEFLLPYESVRAAPDPDAAVLDFFQSTYEAAADLAAWDRAALERSFTSRR